MTKPNKHILVCGSFRASGAPQGVCHKKGSHGLLGYLETELSDRGMSDVTVTLTGCLKACDRGPIMVVYPENTWYGGIEGEDQIDTVLDALEADSVAEEFVLK
ncbi:MAG: (2Fe-2S) ferredoxin domain-containing protein [Treponemataceae bacterium]